MSNNTYHQSVCLIFQAYLYFIILISTYKEYLDYGMGNRYIIIVIRFSIIRVRIYWYLWKQTNSVNGLKKMLEVTAHWREN